LFRPLRGNGKPLDPAGRMDPDAIDRMVRKYAAKIGLARGYSAHSMRATFITTALENGAQLEDVQKAAGHRDPSTTKLYDRRGYNPEKAASFFATYYQPSDLAGARGVCQMSASWIHNPQSPHSNSMQISPRWAEHREIRKEHREERESQLAADLEMSRTAEQSAAAMAQMVIKSGFILNGGGIIAIPAVATLFSLDAEKMLSQLMLTAGLFIGGLSVAWLASIFGFFALAHKGDLSYTNALSGRLAFSKVNIRRGWRSRWQKRQRRRGSDQIGFEFTSSRNDALQSSCVSQVSSCLSQAR
jgi:integrase-like protein